MKPRIYYLTIGLLSVLLTSCAPQVTQPQVTNETPPVVAVATSRGANLEATDPATVSLASGQLQLVEFFRFT